MDLGQLSGAVTSLAVMLIVAGIAYVAFRIIECLRASFR